MKINLNLIAILFCLMAVGCGKDKVVREVHTQTTVIEKFGGRIIGDCTLTGHIRFFEIGFTKAINDFSFKTETGFIIKSNNKITLNSFINDVFYNLNIERQMSKLVGSEKLADQIEVSIEFSDSSECSVSLWVKK